MLAALGLLQRLPDATTAGFTGHRVLEPIVSTIQRLLATQGATATLTVAFNVLAEVLKQPFPQSLYHMVAAAFEGVVECVARRPDGDG